MTSIMIASDPQAALSKNHRLVYEIVREQGAGTHLAMAQLFELARERQPSIGFTTVYRALTRLRDAGMVMEIQLPGAECAVYEPAAPPHAHFRCSVCGRVEDVVYAVPDGVAVRLANTHGFAVERIDVALTGRCASCA
jgi:Fur family transcriptional regulator, ferric uptake regulator